MGEILSDDQRDLVSCLPTSISYENSRGNNTTLAGLWRSQFLQKWRSGSCHQVKTPMSLVLAENKVTMEQRVAEGRHSITNDAEAHAYTCFLPCSITHFPPPSLSLVRPFYIDHYSDGYIHHYSVGFWWCRCACDHLRGGLDNIQRP